MRSKEEAHDYRYFPEPDLPPLVVGAGWIEEARRSLPELPAERRQRLASGYGLPDYDASVLTQERAVADFFEAAAQASGNSKAVSNWVMTDVLRKLKESGRGIAESPVSPAALAGLVRLIDAGTISGKIAKDVFERMWSTGEEAPAIVEREGLTQLSDDSALEAIVAEVVARSPEQAASYRGGKAAALGWFVGQVMKRTGGRANPQRVNDLLRKSLRGGPEPPAER
jgi:aspartyl-tRNA(Asn)/glutamyl-tRNA(Gln) amidotransferase subunit B